MDETHTHFLYFVVLLLISIIDIETKQFCLSYVENYNEIDYGLRQIKDKNESNSFLFIDNHYWDLDFIDDSDDNKKTVNLWMTESRKSIHWFGGHYSMAFALWRPGSQRRSCVFALINGNKTLVDFRVRVGHIGREHKIKEYQKVIETPIEFIDLNPSIAFVPNREQYLGRLVVFVERKRLDPQKFQIISKVYEFDDNYIGTEVSNISQLNDTNPIALNDLDPELDVIAIMAQMDRSGVYGLIIVFRFDKHIKYCWTPDRQLSHNCKKENLKTLIDCTGFEFNVNNTTEYTTQTYNITEKTYTITEKTSQNVSEYNISENVSKQIDSKHELHSDHQKDNRFPAFLYVLIPVVVCLLIMVSIYWRYKYKRNNSDSDIDLKVLEEVVDEDSQQTSDTNNKQRY